MGRQPLPPPWARRWLSSHTGWRASSSRYKPSYAYQGSYSPTCRLPRLLYRGVSFHLHASSHPARCLIKRRAVSAPPQEMPGTAWAPSGLCQRDRYLCAPCAQCCRLLKWSSLGRWQALSATTMPICQHTPMWHGMMSPAALCSPWASNGTPMSPRCAPFIHTSGSPTEAQTCKRAHAALCIPLSPFLVCSISVLVTSRIQATAKVPHVPNTAVWALERPTMPNTCDLKCRCALHHHVCLNTRLI